MADGLLLEDLAPAMQESPDDIARLRMALASASSCLADIVNEVATDDDGMESSDFARSKVATLTSQVEQLTTEKVMLVDSLSEAHRALQEARKLLHDKGIDFPGDLPAGKRGGVALDTGDPSRDKWHQELEGAQHVIQDLQAQNRMLEGKLEAAKGHLQGKGIDPDIVLELQKSKAREAELLTELSVMQGARDELIAKEHRREEALRMSVAGESLGSANFTVESLQSKVEALEAVIEDNTYEMNRLKQQQKDSIAPPKNQLELQTEISALKQELQAARDLLESSTRQRASAVEELHSVQSGGEGKVALETHLHEVEAGLVATKGLFEDEMGILKQQLAASRAEVAALKSRGGGSASTASINLTPESIDAGHQLEIESQKLSLNEKRCEQLEAKNRDLEEKLGALTGGATATRAAGPSMKLAGNNTGPGGGLVTVDASELAKLRWELKTRKRAHLAWEGERELLQGDIVALKAELERIQVSTSAVSGKRSVPAQSTPSDSSGVCARCPGLESELQEDKEELQRNQHELDALRAQLDNLQNDHAEPSEGSEGPCSNNKCASQKTSLRLEVSQLKDELVAREGTAGDRDKQTLSDLKQTAADTSDEVDQLRHQMNALKIENEKLKKAAQERWEQDKADHHNKKGKMNRIAELKVRELEAELNNVRQKYLAEKEQVQSVANKLEKENKNLKRQQDRRGTGALSKGNYVESEHLMEEDQEEPVEIETSMSPTSIGLVDSEDVEHVYQGAEAQHPQSRPTNRITHRGKFHQMMKHAPDKRVDMGEEQPGIGLVDPEDVEEVYKAFPRSTGKWRKSLSHYSGTEAAPNQNFEALQATQEPSSAVDHDVVDQAFDKLDVNHDGVLNREEFHEGIERAHNTAVADEQTSKVSKWGNKKKMLEGKRSRQLRM